MYFHRFVGVADGCLSYNAKSRIYLFMETQVYRNYVLLSLGMFQEWRQLSRIHLRDLVPAYTSLEVKMLGSKTATIINPDIFQNLPYHTFLDLSNNLLTTLTSNFFDSLTNVSSVSLGFNSLTFLPEDVFFNLNLFHIDLGDNKLESLPEKIFKKIIKIIARTYFFMICGTFYGLLDVYKIILRGNRLSQISVEWFKNTSKLRIFEMRNNHIENNFPEHIFSECLIFERFGVG
ncbi:hypothetical protein LAZ67_5000958 [Cordylochernes scorpioides]|uniref:Uncharacterized protein n=1 Tax=Cordylochernes scorpioides TaxID=51811 RepID=A0ABY6KF87_9ARAC|nr:hypothetical protein LAZ67_5000958 [Cordylochernes scorpioides]